MSGRHLTRISVCQNFSTEIGVQKLSKSLPLIFLFCARSAVVGFYYFSSQGSLLALRLRLLGRLFVTTR